MDMIKPMHFIEREEKEEQFDTKPSMQKEFKSPINVDIKLILGDKFKHGDKHDKLDGLGKDAQGCKAPDWESIAKQLLQSISLMDTQTDAVESGMMEPQAAVDSMDEMTSRILWGKQEETNPLSSYQNANYGQSVAAGLNMQNPAVLFNNDAYGAYDPDHDGDYDFNAAGQMVDPSESSEQNEPDWKSMCLMLMKECGIKPPELEGQQADGQQALLDKLHKSEMGNNQQTKQSANASANISANEDKNKDEEDDPKKEKQFPIKR